MQKSNRAQPSPGSSNSKSRAKRESSRGSRNSVVLPIAKTRSRDGTFLQHSKLVVGQFGSRLRHARLTKGMSLRQVAEEVGCSQGFVSKIEGSKVNPSLTVLHRLVAVLEINVAALFADDNVLAGPVVIMNEGNRAKIRVDPLRKGPGITLERLVANPMAALLQANIHHVAPLGSTDGFIQHEGEELGYVLKGELELIVDGVKYLIKQGDSFFFHSNLAHGYRNPGKSEAAVVWINTPPTF